MTEIKLDFKGPEVEDGPLFRRPGDHGHPYPLCTRGVLRTLEENNIDIEKLLDKHLELINHPEPLDYLQTASIEETRVWVIDDGEAVTWLLPEEY